MKKIVFIGGSIQVLITILVTALITMYSGYPVMLSIFIGYLVSHSSTTIMLKFFESRKEVESLYSKSGLGISIFQDMTSIPMLLSIPLIIGSSANMNQDPLSIIIKLIGLVILIYVSTKWIVPSIFYHVLKTKSREMFLITSMIICFSFALVTYEIGLSLSLGAFLAGLIISESEYSVSVKSIVLPFRDLFISLFFVSIGMLLDWNFLLNQGWTVMLFTGIVVALKFIIAFAACLLTNLKTKTSIITALALSQIGEFSFVLSKAGVEQGLFSNELNQLFLNVAIFTMCIIPLLLTLVFRIIDKRKIVIDM